MALSLSLTPYAEPLSSWGTCIKLGAEAGRLAKKGRRTLRRTSGPPISLSPWTWLQGLARRAPGLRIHLGWVASLHRGASALKSAELLNEPNSPTEISIFGDFGGP